MMQVRVRVQVLATLHDAGTCTCAHTGSRMRTSTSSMRAAGGGQPTGLVNWPGLGWAEAVK